jgi:hypothetical protein
MSRDDVENMTARSTQLGNAAGLNAARPSRNVVGSTEELLAVGTRTDVTHIHSCAFVPPTFAKAKIEGSAKRFLCLELIMIGLQVERKTKLERLVRNPSVRFRTKVSQEVSKDAVAAIPRVRTAHDESQRAAIVIDESTGLFTFYHDNRDSTSLSSCVIDYGCDWCSFC